MIHTEEKHQVNKEIVGEDAHLQWAIYFPQYFPSQNRDNNANKSIRIKSLL